MIVIMLVAVIMWVERGPRLCKYLKKDRTLYILYEVIGSICGLISFDLLRCALNFAWLGLAWLGWNRLFLSGIVVDGRGKQRSGEREVRYL
jgi:hypothetical protein